MCLAISNNSCSCYRMPQNAFFSTNLQSSGQPKNNADTFFSTLHPLSTVIFATATVLAFVLLRDIGSVSVIHSVKQRLLRNRPGSALRPLATSCAKDYNRIHSSKPASLNRPIYIVLVSKGCSDCSYTHSTCQYGLF